MQCINDVFFKDKLWEIFVYYCCSIISKMRIICHFVSLYIKLSLCSPFSPQYCLYILVNTGALSFNAMAPLYYSLLFRKDFVGFGRWLLIFILLSFWLFLLYDSRYITNWHPFYLCYFTPCLSLIIVKIDNPLLSLFADYQCYFSYNIIQRKKN